jgi:hypothetical protein
MRRVALVLSLVVAALFRACGDADDADCAEGAAMTTAASNGALDMWRRP